MRSNTTLLLALGAAILSPSGATAQSSKEYATMGLSAWAAFECSAVASVIENSKEQERLFKYGYDRGKQFIVAARGNKVARADLESTVPIGFLWVAEGPTPDFILGRVYASALDSALKEVYGKPGELNPKELRQVIAERRFRDGNCELLGK